MGGGQSSVVAIVAPSSRSSSSSLCWTAADLHLACWRWWLAAAAAAAMVARHTGLFRSSGVVRELPLWPERSPTRVCVGPAASVCLEDTDWSCYRGGPIRTGPVRLCSEKRRRPRSPGRCALRRRASQRLRVGGWRPPARTYGPVRSILCSENVGVVQQNVETVLPA